MSVIKNIRNYIKKWLFPDFSYIDSNNLIFITAEGGIFLKKYYHGGGLMLVRKLTYKNILGGIE
ncbi:hypothetical protein [Brachyspira hyodysenteriae]|uniref:hypothetical protein n=1 Tax=Brachyspira hyodysenteriae TaxID=159 RepID=UPI0022CDD47B|nr:hypothetical protein [Brachyspira hyodysenteriae]MCZ9977096.1 hypothetical protein [Brachyspira hyodysenteriae]